MIQKKKTRMYEGSIQQKNPLKGCYFECGYCAFRALMNRGFSKCPECKSFVPHWHDNVLDKPPKKTGENQFVSICLNGDISNCSYNQWQQILKYCDKYPETTFLIQSKDPSCFWEHCSFPNNVIVCTTLETNRDEGYHLISKAPVPSIRADCFKQVRYHRKIITIEPILAFDLDKFVYIINNINNYTDEIKCLEAVYVGYANDNHDGKRLKLPEPKLEDTMKLIETIKKLGIEVRLKTIRRAWFENK